MPLANGELYAGEFCKYDRILRPVAAKVIDHGNAFLLRDIGIYDWPYHRAERKCTACIYLKACDSCFLYQDRIQIRAYGPLPDYYVSFSPSAVQQRAESAAGALLHLNSVTSNHAQAPNRQDCNVSTIGYCICY